MAGAFADAAGNRPRSLAVRSITTPFALAAAQQIGGQPALVALFVVMTGVFDMAMGDVLFLCIAVKQGVAKGAGLGLPHMARVRRGLNNWASRRGYPVWS